MIRAFTPSSVIKVKVRILKVQLSIVSHLYGAKYIKKRLFVDVYSYVTSFQYINLVTKLVLKHVNFSFSAFIADSGKYLSAINFSKSYQYGTPVLSKVGLKFEGALEYYLW